METYSTCGALLISMHGLSFRLKMLGYFRFSFNRSLSFLSSMFYEKLKSSASWTFDDLFGFSADAPSNPAVI